MDWFSGIWHICHFFWTALKIYPYFWTDMCRAAVPCMSSGLSGNVFYSFLKYFLDFMRLEMQMCMFLWTFTRPASSDPGCFPFILLNWEADSPALHNHCHAGWSCWICLICCLISQTVFPAHPLSLPEWLLNDDVLSGQTEICLSIYVRLYCYVLLLKGMFLHRHVFLQMLKHTDT